MSLKKIEQVKRDRGFKIPDLIVYGAVIVAVIVSFVVIFTTKNSDPLTGIRVYSGAQIVFEYEFGERPTYSENVTVEENGAGITVKVNDGDGGFNVIYIDKTARTAKIVDANCKGKDCAYFAPIDDNNKIIYCSPHGLRVEPLFRDLDSPDIIM